jgi:predicted RNase H-like HicB family nuclease
MVEVKGRKFTVILREETEGGYSAQCIELPGAISQGETRKQAISNIREAIEGYLEAFPEKTELARLSHYNFFFSQALNH